MSLNEAETRQQIIDRKLKLAGWNVTDPSQVIQELDIVLKGQGDTAAEPNPSPYAGHRFADYALVDKGKPVAVVEAKKASKNAALGREQAVQYAQNIQEIHGGLLPFISYTNGHDIYFQEPEFYPPVKVHGFPSRNDLEWLHLRRESRRPLSTELINTDIAGRDYQIAAIRSILEGVEAKRQKFLLVMATGTGKTRTAAALMDVLIRARWAKRILVLVDRIALRDQGLEAFKEHIPSEPIWPQTGEKGFAKDRRIYVTTYPTMLNMIESGTAPESRISPFFFDVVIADESHRSIYNIYKSVIDYFNAIKLGLTATPRDHIDHDTFKVFECDANDPTFAYTYEEAVSHEPPFLCDFEVLKVRSKFQMEGIKGAVLPAPVQKKLITEGKDVEDIDFEGTDLERKVSNSGTNALILREFMEESLKDESGVLPGKTIIFAISKAHAYRLQELFDSMYPEFAGKLARVLVSEDRYVHGKGGLLDQFKNQDFPRIAISVDMLDTGVDVREIVNLVFAKPVYSYVKFWQMIGRGTRVLEESEVKRKPWCKAKDRFLIIDCWGNFEHFKMHPKGKEPNSQVPMPVRLFKARIDRLEAALTKERPDIAASVISALRQDIESLPANNVIVSEQSANLAEVKVDQFWERLGAQSIGFLRSTIAPVLRVRTGLDVKSIRFETDVVELGTALLTENKAAFEAIRESLVEQVSELPLTVNIVAHEKALIEEVLRPIWWTSITEEKMQAMIARLAPLMRYRQRSRDAMVKLNIEDLVAIKETIEFGPEHERLSTSAYRERLEAYVRELAENNPVLQKIRDDEKVSPSEIHELAKLLEEQSLHVTEDVLRKVYDHKTARFIQFMRHILGLEKLESWTESVTSAFDAFIAEHNTFTELQIRFLRTLQTFILQTGKVERHHLIDAPFTGIHPQGIRGVFKPDEINEVIGLAEKLAA